MTNLANTPGSGVTKYTDETTAYQNLVPGDIIVFSRDGDLVHVAIYAGTYSMWNIRGTNRGEKHFIIHVGNSRGPEISTTEYLAKSGTAKESVATAWYHLELGSIVDQTGFIEIYKKDPNGKNLSGAKFKAVDQETGDTFYIGPTNANGYAKSGELPLGTYKVTETVFPDGYEASGTTEWTVTLTEDTPDMTITIEAENKLKTGYIEVYKKDENGSALAGATFTAVNQATNASYTIGPTNANGYAKSAAIPFGTYKVTETAFPEGFEASGTTEWTVTIDDDTTNRTVTVEAVNKKKVGYIEIYKEDENGSPLAGAVFTAVNQATNESYTIGPTNANGYAKSASIPFGTYKVTETVFPEGFEASGTTEWTVTIDDDTSNRTVTVEAVNKKTDGKAKIIKKATNGGTVAGWHFEVKNSSGTVIGNYVTDSTGIITINLTPGTYTITETDGEYKYWVNDPNPTRTVTVKSGETASVTFTNQWRGQAQIIKATTNGGSVAGWHFEVKNSSGTVIGNYVTDNTGIITLDLEPGTYTVTETDGESQYWQNDPNPTKTVTVKAGQTAKVTFTNKYQGEAQIIKTATNGGTVAGWHFEVKNSGGTVVGTYVTDSTGIIALALEPGTYTVTETDGEKEYWENDPNPTKTVTVKAGQTAKVTFRNQWIGKAKVIKTATNGGSVEGWSFTIKNTAGTFVGKYTTDANGLIVADLEPGTYTVQETPVDDPYWVCDTEVKTITVKAGETASVSFQNRYIGKAKIIKTLADPNSGSVEGWTFEIKDANGSLVGTYTTDADGTILCELAPGQYTVTEILEEDSCWECISDISQTVTVRAGQTAEVSFVNSLKPAQITVYKVDMLGAPLADAEFLLEWSEDGTNWAPVVYSDSEHVTKGGCSSAGLTEGKLVSGRDGVVSFTGLYPGLHYRLTETRAPEGYQMLTGPAFEGTITAEENLHVELNVVNALIFELPMTGSTESAVVRGFQIAAAVALLALLLYIAKKRR